VVHAAAGLPVIVVHGATGTGRGDVSLAFRRGSATGRMRVSPDKADVENTTGRGPPPMLCV
jgi:hypothetical protein